MMKIIVDAIALYVMCSFTLAGIVKAMTSYELLIRIQIVMHFWHSCIMNINSCWYKANNVRSIIPFLLWQLDMHRGILGYLHFSFYYIRKAIVLMKYSQSPLPFKEAYYYGLFITIACPVIVLLSCRRHDYFSGWDLTLLDQFSNHQLWLILHTLSCMYKSQFLHFFWQCLALRDKQMGSKKNQLYCFLFMHRFLSSYLLEVFLLLEYRTLLPYFPFSGLCSVFPTGCPLASSSYHLLFCN